ncbi:MAG: hypothetical protein RLZZ241_2582 [Bacteroidota bacterium]|jgi:glycosyltransferase involved in cell wall biosynthesis
MQLKNLQQMTKIKIVFVLPNLMPGGAEKVVSFIAQNLDPNQFSPELWIIGSKSEKDFEVSGITLKYFNIQRVRNSFTALFKALRKHKPQVVLSSITYLNVMMGFLSVFLPKIKFIGREANILSIKSKIDGKGNPLNRLMFLLFFNKLDLIICQSQDMLNDFVINYKMDSRKLALINNPIPEGKSNQVSESQISGQPIKFVTVGKFKKQKGHERLLRAVSKIDVPFEYTLIGDGGEKDKISRLITELNLTDKIKHIPFSNNVEAHLMEHHIFLQGAFIEGFPNCLLESCAVGLPIVAFDAPGGLNEIIVTDLNGYRCQDESEFIAALSQAINTEWNREAIRKDIFTRYGSDKIIAKYESLFKDVLSS